MAAVYLRNAAEWTAAICFARRLPSAAGSPAPCATKRRNSRLANLFVLLPERSKARPATFEVSHQLRRILLVEMASLPLRFLAYHLTNLAQRVRAQSI
jgi:hypothetical protein